MRPLTLVINSFFGTSFALGVPSLIAFSYLAFNTLRMWMIRPPAMKRPSSSDDLIRGLEWGAYAFGKAFELLGAFGFFACVMLTAAAATLVAFSTLLFATARGLELHQAWARWSGFCLMSLVLFPSLVLFLSGARTIGLLLTAASTYAIFTLWRHWN